MNNSIESIACKSIEETLELAKRINKAIKYIENLQEEKKEKLVFVNGIELLGILKGEI